jgi:hypothetical protein
MGPQTDNTKNSWYISFQSVFERSCTWMFDLVTCLQPFSRSIFLLTKLNRHDIRQYCQNDTIAGMLARPPTESRSTGVSTKLMTPVNENAFMAHA